MVTTPIKNLVKNALPSMDGDSNLIRDTWDRLHALPGGKVAFSKLVGRMAPYTGTVGAVVTELGMGHATVKMRDRRAVRNHLRCIHAIAQLNVAELCGNVALAYSLPDDARFIVAGMSIEYLKKARGTLTAVCDVPPIETSERKEFQIEVLLKNPKREVVSKVLLRTLVGPKKR